MIGPHDLGKTMLLMNGEECVLIRMDEDKKTYHSDTRSWDREGNEMSGDTERRMLGPKQDLIWRVQFSGYGQTDGSYVAETLTLSTQLLALQLVRTYNDRVKDLRPNGNGSFVRAGEVPVTVPEDLSMRFDDDRAREIISNDEVLDLR